MIWVVLGLVLLSAGCGDMEVGGGGVVSPSTVPVPAPMLRHHDPIPAPLPCSIPTLMERGDC